MEDDRIRWDARWSDAASGEPGPPDALRDRDDLDALVPRAGRALDVACGLGNVAVWLATRGLDVTGVDVSPVAIDAATRLAAACGVEARCRFEVVDLDQPRRGRAPFDGAPFDMIVCQRFHDPALYPVLAASLAPGGLLVVTVLSVVGRDDTSSPFLAEPGELVRAFADLQLVAAAEADGEASVLVRCSA
jgi:SAM-dependent methyltransferase